VQFDKVKARVRALPQVAGWPQMQEMIDRAVQRGLQSVWDLPALACEAVGGPPAAALGGAAAVFCSLISIHLVDDMLDDDPQGDFHRFGAGPAANLAIAFQSAGHAVLDQPPVTSLPPAVRAELHACLGRMALATAFGQHLDCREVSNEDEYWQVIGTKTPPLFGAALRLGALLGGAAPEVACRLESLGNVLGKFIQVSDDLADALRTPAGADWHRRANNLPIHYAMVADHPARAEFLALSAAVDDPQALAGAQQLLLASGGVSYCAFKMIELLREAHGILEVTPLLDKGPLQRLLAEHTLPLEHLLSAVGLDEPISSVLQHV
jgi:geranylgeranyl diphosphate synthase type I